MPLGQTAFQQMPFATFCFIFSFFFFAPQKHVGQTVKSQSGMEFGLVGSEWLIVYLASALASRWTQVSMSAPNTPLAS